MNSIDRMARRSAMIDAEIANVARVAYQLELGYYSDSTHDETQRASDFLRALFNERESEMNDTPIRDDYGYVAFAHEHGYDDV